MSGAEFADFRVLIVPGLHGSGPDHWQTRWQELYPSFERVMQACWDVPDLPAWSDCLGRTLRQSDRPTLIVAHSFGCLASMYRGGSEAPHLAGALLVAPADPDKFGVTDILSETAPHWPSIVVGRVNDPWMDSRRASDWARRWGSQFVNAGALGHINAASRLGDWPFGLALLRQLTGFAAASASLRTRSPAARR